MAALEGIAFQYRSNLDEIPAEVPEIVAAATERLNDVERVRYDAVFLFAEGEIWVETEGEVRWVDRVDDTHTQRAVDGLVDRLSDPVEAIVRKATSALGLYVWSETDALVDHVGDLIDYGWERSGPNRSSIRRCLKETAADHPEAVVDYVPYFLERLDEGDPDAATVVGHAAAADLDAVRDGVPDIVDVLGSPEGRVAAAKALADVYRVDPGAVPDYVETLTETIDGSEVTTRRSALWEPLATLAEDYPGVASDLAEQAVGGLARLDDPPRLRLLYELAETEPSTVGPAVDRLLELFEHDDPAVVAAAVRTLWYVFDREDTPDVPASAAESLERRLDELPEQAREDAEPIISSAKDR